MIMDEYELLQQIIKKKVKGKTHKKSIVKKCSLFTNSKRN